MEIASVRSRPTRARGLKLPVVGAALVWGPTAVYLLVTGHYWQGAILIAYGACVIGLADNLLRPVLVGRDTKLPDFLVLLSTLGGFMMFGMDGFVTGPTLAVLFVTVWQIFMEECGRGGVCPDDGQDGGAFSLCAEAQPCMESMKERTAGAETLSGESEACRGEGRGMGASLRGSGTGDAASCGDIPARED